MDLKLHQCFVAVDDHDKALHFYVEVLGLEVRNDVSFEGMRWVTVGSPLQPDVDLVLEPPGANPDFSPPTGRRWPGCSPRACCAGSSSPPPTATRCTRGCRRPAVEVLQEPTDQPYGVRDCAFRDPAGNMLRFMERTG